MAKIKKLLLMNKTIINPQKNLPIMQKVVLPNGLTVIYKEKPGKAVVVEVMVKVGSNDEAARERGISHFLEHILFEGTTKRPSNRAITNEIESIGGDFNAYTTNERTSFHVKVLQKHFPIAVEILADIIQHPLLRVKDINREKNVVLKEIDLVTDEPRFYQWILLQKHLFRKHPSGYPTYGDKKVIASLTRKKIKDYYCKHYVPGNMIIAVVGDIKNWKQQVSRRFKAMPGMITPHQATTELSLTNNIEHRERRKIANTYTVMGFKTVSAMHDDAPAIDVINGILGRGQSGRMFAEIRSRHGLAYDVGTQNVSETGFGYFAIYASIDRKNVKMVQELMLKELRRLQDVAIDDIKEAQEFVEGSYYLLLEDSQKVADQLLFWELAKDAEEMDKYIHKVKQVTVEDVKRVAKQYFKYYAFVVLEGR